MSELPKPTLRRMVEVMEKSQTDRIVMVRRGTVYREPGLFIVMSGGPAVRDLGPVCIEAASKVVDEGEPPLKEGDLDPDESLEDWFEMMERKKRYFLWGKEEDPFRMHAFFLGRELCEYLAPRLTELGCPCCLKQNED